MALDIQTVFPVRAYTPYERPPDIVALWSAIPRGMLSFTAFEALDAKALNDEALVTIPWVLPSNFAYVLESLHFSITQNRAQDWSDRVNLNLQNFARWGVVGLNGNYRRGFEASTQDVNTRTITDIGGNEGITSFPTFPLVNPETANGVAFNFNAFNNTATAATAGTLHFYCNFWEFDLEQVRKYPINSPVPVQLR